jgi:flagellar hook protein FlgE
MALFGALSTGRSGLINNAAALSVIGNNIANVSTVGFKGSRTEFADLISAEAGGQIGKIGLGSRIGAVRTLFTQGAIESTGRALDLGIEGTGFFVLREGEGQLFTRAGNFQIEPVNGAITNLLGNVLQGRPINPDGSLAGDLQDVTVGGLQAQASASTTGTLRGNLQADAELLGTPPGTFDPTTFQSAIATSNLPTSIRVFDSLGKGHDLSVFFTRTGTNAWAFNFGVDEGETGGTAGDLQIVGSGTMSFNPDGSLNTIAGNTATVTFAGANPQTITFDFGTPGGGRDGFTQFAGTTSGTNFVFQNGFGAGGLVSLGVNAQGVLSATFDNGQTRPLFQLAMAQFTAVEGLAPAGNQLFRETIDSGPPAIGTPGALGNGTVVSSSLEQSNVQIAQEFIDLISTQRSFQANTRVITASDALLSDLINIVR